MKSLKQRSQDYVLIDGKLHEWNEAEWIRAFIHSPKEPFWLDRPVPAALCWVFLAISAAIVWGLVMVPASWWDAFDSFKLFG